MPPVRWLPISELALKTSWRQKLQAAAEYCCHPESSVKTTLRPHQSHLHLCEVSNPMSNLNNTIRKHTFNEFYKLNLVIMSSIRLVPIKSLLVHICKMSYQVRIPGCKSRIENTFTQQGYFVPVALYQLA